MTIPVNDSTTYHAQTAASAADVTDGTQVKVQVEVDRGQGGAAASPGAQPSPGASSRASFPGGLRFGTATDVTIVGD